MAYYVRCDKRIERNISMQWLEKTRSVRKYCIFGTFRHKTLPALRYSRISYLACDNKKISFRNNVWCLESTGGVRWPLNLTKSALRYTIPSVISDVIFAICFLYKECICVQIPSSMYTVHSKLVEKSSVVTVCIDKFYMVHNAICLQENFSNTEWNIN